MINQYLLTIIFVNIVSELRLNYFWCFIYGLLKNKIHSAVPVNTKNLQHINLKSFYFMNWKIILEILYYINKTVVWNGTTNIDFFLQIE